MGYHEHIAVEMRVGDLLDHVRHALRKGDGGLAAGGRIPRGVGSPAFVLIVPVSRNGSSRQAIPRPVVEFGEFSAFLHGQFLCSRDGRGRGDGALEWAGVDRGPRLRAVRCREGIGHCNAVVGERRIEPATTEHVGATQGRLAVTEEIELECHPGSLQSLELVGGARGVPQAPRELSGQNDVLHAGNMVPFGGSCSE